MSRDARLRRSSRRFARWRDHLARSRHIVEQVRAGHLSRAQLRLAAYLGDPAAGLAVGTEARHLPSRDVVEWLGGLARFGLEPCVRAGAVAARLERSAFAGIGPEAPRYDAILWHLEQWLACPCRGHARAVEAAIPLADLLLSAAWERSPARWTALAVSGRAPPRHLLLRWPGVWRRPGLVYRLGPEGLLRHAVRAALIPWVLDEEAPSRGW